MTAITSDLYFTNIRILPTAANATVCRSWYANVIGILQKQKQTFYELQIYNLIVNKYSNYPPRTYNIRRRLDFAKEHGGHSARSDNIFENNINSKE
jgi:hypothetical protein